MTTPCEELLARISTVPGARSAVFPAAFVPMLAALSEQPFTKAGWIYEPKMDGIRGITLFQNGKVRILSRRNLDLTSQYPGLAAELSQLLSVDAVIDGEIIALNELGLPSFQHLQQRMNLTKETDVLRAEQLVPAYYFVFDVMQVGNTVLTGVKLTDRKKILREILGQSTRVKILQHFEDDGVLAYHACVENGFEGIVAKRLDAGYEPGRRSPSWVKLKAQQTAEFVLGGFTPGEGWRANTFGSLLMGYYDDAGKFIYAGSVGTGFDDKLLNETMRRIGPLNTGKCPFLKKPVDKRDAMWLEPQVVIEVKFMDWTRDGHLRTPVFLRFRDDKLPEEIKKEKPVPLVPSRGSNDSKTGLTAEMDAVVRAQAAAAIREKRSSSGGRKKQEAGVPLEGLDRRERVGAKCSPDPPSESETPVSIPVSAPVSMPLPQAEPIAFRKGILVREDVDAVLSQLTGKEKQFELLVQREKVSLTHLDKVLWPKTDKHEAITKRDYLRAIAELSPFLLGYLHSRPLTLVRSPDGVRGKRFYQKHWNWAPPEYMDMVRLTDSEKEDGIQEYLLCDNLATLLFLAQNGVLEFHTFSSLLSPLTDADNEAKKEHATAPNGTVSAEVESWLDYPDLLVFDLDFHTQTEKVRARPLDRDAFDKTRSAAFMLREVFLSMGLSPFVKTSGKNGVHVVLPIQRNVEFEVVRFVAESVRQFMGKAHRDHIALDTDSSRKLGRVYLDHGPNGRGRTVVAAYSPRFAPEATISCPLSWSDLETARPEDFHILNIADWLSTNGDGWALLNDQPYDLHTVFQKK